MQCPFRTSSLAPIIWLSEGLTDPVQCVYHSIGLRKFTIRKGMELSGSEDDFMVLTSREKKNKKHFLFHPILKTRQGQGEFHPLIEELWRYRDHYQVYFRMSASNLIRCELHYHHTLKISLPIPPYQSIL